MGRGSSEAVPSKLRRAMCAPERNPLSGFVAAEIEAGNLVKTDGWSAYNGIENDRLHLPHVVGAAPAPRVLPWGHRVFSLFKIWALGVYHGLGPEHLQSYLDEFVSRFNRRRTRHAAFGSLLAIAAGKPPITCKMLISPNATV